MTGGRQPDRGAPTVVVIGAGAAGLFAATEAAVRGAEVHLLEKNGKTGVKILMSGGTRCNITQDTDARGIVKAFGPGGRFLQRSVGAFGPSDVIRLFDQLGVATKVESTGKVFPRSNRAVHVRDALERRAAEAGVHIHLRQAVGAVSFQDDRWKVVTDSGQWDCDRVIVTAGGKSWPGCGTTGDAYEWLPQLGHTIVRPRPALVPLVGGFDWTHHLSGLTVDDCQASVFDRQSWDNRPPRKRKPLVTRRGGWLFTHFGFSGPAAMDVSGAITSVDDFDQTRLMVDLLPTISAAELEAELTDRRGGGRRGVLSILDRWLPHRLAESVVAHCGGDRSIAELPRPTLQTLLAAIKSCEFPIHATRGFGKAEVTAGGVSLREVDPRTMESRLVPGLFIAGEVLDVDGWIGGYNFQAAFSTGRAAGIAAARPVTV